MYIHNMCIYTYPHGIAYHFLSLYILSILLQSMEYLRFCCCCVVWKVLEPINLLYLDTQLLIFPNIHLEL